MTELPQVTVRQVRPHLQGHQRRVHLIVNGSQVGAVECESTPWAFGGARWWLLCPFCGHRRTALYGHRIIVDLVDQGDASREVYHWGCRVCLKLGYPSQRLSRYWLLHHRGREVWRRLGGTDETFEDPRSWRWPKRPKGMRRATQARLKDEYCRLAEEDNAEGCAILRRFLARYGAA